MNILLVESYIMEEMKGVTTMTWEELEDCGVSVKQLRTAVFYWAPYEIHCTHRCSNHRITTRKTKHPLVSF